MAQHDDKAPGVDCISQPDLGAGDAYAYPKWKDWGAEAFGVLSQRDEADFSAHLRRSGMLLPPGSRVLEMGFGNGGFLTYARKRGWDITGTEINPELVRRATEHGFCARHAENLALFSENHFDFVIIYDVLEHIPQERLLDLLSDVKRVLKDDGMLIARFPNGDSPFSRFSQHGDPTHLTTIGSLKAKYFAATLNMKVVYVGGELQPLRAGLPHFAYRIVANPIRFLMNAFLNFMFCPGNHKSLCTTNLIMILRKTHADPSTDTGLSD